jgi:hypothetical protein
MTCRWRLVLLMVCMASIPAHVLATTIVMIVETSVTVTDQSVDVRLEVGNQGDEDALVVTPFFALAGVETGLEAVPDIAFGGKRIWTHSFPVGDLEFPEAGTYPLVVRLRYHDAHMYPYSMVSAVSVQVGEGLPEIVPLTGELTSEQVSGEGTLDLRVSNTGHSPLEARITMISPTELVVAGDSGKLNIPAGKEKQISYAVKNNGSLPGSNHIVHAIIEYSTSGQHGVVILEEGVAVASYIANKKRTIIIASAGFIALLFFFVLFLEFRAGASAA